MFAISSRRNSTSSIGGSPACLTARAAAGRAPGGGAGDRGRLGAGGQLEHPPARTARRRRVDERMRKRSPNVFVTTSDLRAAERAHREIDRNHVPVVAVADREFDEQHAREIFRARVDRAEIDLRILEFPEACRGHAAIADRRRDHRAHDRGLARSSRSPQRCADLTSKSCQSRWPPWYSAAVSTFSPAAARAHRERVLHALGCHAESRRRRLAEQGSNKQPRWRPRFTSATSAGASQRRRQRGDSGRRTQRRAERQVQRAPSGTRRGISSRKPRVSASSAALGVGRAA